MSPSAPPSLRTIAAQAGVSPATVSLALRNHPSIPAATRERVQAIARRMGYRPNALVAAMLTQVRRKRPPTERPQIAWLMPLSPAAERASRLALPFYDDVIRGATQRAEERGYRLEQIWTKEPGMTGRRLTAVLLARNIRGVLLAPIPPARGHLSLDWSEFAAAAVGYSMWFPAVHRAIVNHFEFTRDAYRRLARLGHQRIGLAIPHNLNERVNRQLSAAVADCQLTEPRARCVPPLLWKRWEERSFAAWFERHRPDAVLTQALQVVDGLRARGAAIPADVSCVFLGGGSSPPGFTTIDNRGDAIGAAAVDLVVEQLHHYEYGLPLHPKLVMVPGRWIDGTSVRARR